MGHALKTVQTFQSAVAVGLLIAFFLPWGQFGDLNGSGYDIALQLGGHASVLLLVLFVAAEPLLKNVINTRSLLSRLVAGIFVYCVYLAIVSNGEIGSILLLIPVMALNLLIKSLSGEHAQLHSAFSGLLTLGILVFGVIHLAGKNMEYLAVFQCASVGFFVSVALGFSMLLYGGRGLSGSSSK